MRKPIFSILFLSVAAAAPNAHGEAAYSCLFKGALQDCGFTEQSKVPGRASLVNVGGMRGVRLHTEPGDSNVYGSRAAERNDLRLSSQASDCEQGRKHWWAHSILFPDDYVAPPESTATTWNWGVVADFHNSAPIGPVVRNQWYNFVYHVQWSSGADGFFDAWVNGVQKMAYRGPTLYPGQGCYFKLANYHTALGKRSSVIHARVIRGVTPRAVTAGPLQGVLP